MTKANLVKCKNRIGIIDGEGNLIEFVTNPDKLKHTEMQDALFNAALEKKAEYKGDDEAKQV